MRKFLNISAYLILLYVVYLAVANFGQTVNVQFGAVHNLVDMGLPVVESNISLGLFTFCVLMIGFVVSTVIVGQFYLVQKDKLNAYKRELEKTSVSNSTSSSKVEVLQAKIATLEKALDDVLNKNQ